MTDFDEREISALENVFSDAKVLLGDFHRNQAWERWTKRKDNSMGRASDIIKYLHQLANAPDPESFDTALQKFVDSDVWQGNVQLQQYCQRVWFPHKKRCAKAYRSGKFEVIAGTNNGLESSHCTFKKFFLHGETNFNLSNMLRSLIKDFFPSRYRTYVEKNRLYSGKFRNYSEDVPPYLRSRPKNFIKHCLESLELSKSIERSQVESKGDGIFFINGGTK
ncbi:uncharacterized protein LOC128557101 [Mercenaria mercenaria]|uniref:uncharacterized protein LOC128557101 n=1 Tax=Mercenaria mercenaria TaxID=6596 RepID=UPI00234F6F42|nr:uncharacterized protein LOC128557101 [Mercenaria mercenaria]